MLLTMLVANFAASWYATFSGQDAFDIQEKRPGLFFVFFVFAVVVLTFVINGLGYILQLIYVLTYGGGYYDPDEWRLLMSHPILATSYNDFWNYRWHQLFRCIWLAIPFRPVLLLLKNNTNNSNPEKKQQQSSQASLALATLAVFFVSGLMHEYLILCGSGVRAYWNELIGQECLFFTLHGMAVILERAVQPYLKVQTGVLADTLKRIWVIWFAFRTFPLFLNGFAYWELWHANPFNMFTPYFLENVWRKYTILHAFCGSYL
ncbi:hypothetical protein BDB00DRAFT_288433 [Zychaea mexicana]|uniref:uncharacterized protein n=1 Tax=Zychaea mexicana TaxID=64656 RepID=UPI0022FE5E5E|nr:uncharacterized protein BDB00DRAFT_288433 [Zychaea mexicana]KAI9494775.1 hypothetical protein BDB00DRAFT_288433 [Zychaea mexicana]